MHFIYPIYYRQLAGVIKGNYGEFVDKFNIPIWLPSLLGPSFVSMSFILTWLHVKTCPCVDTFLI